MWGLGVVSAFFPFFRYILFVLFGLFYFFFLFVVFTYYFSYHTHNSSIDGSSPLLNIYFWSPILLFFCPLHLHHRTLYIITLIRRSKKIPPTNKHKVAGNLLFFVFPFFSFFLSYPTKTKHQHFKTPNKTFFFLPRNHIIILFFLGEMVPQLLGLFWRRAFHDLGQSGAQIV